MPDANRWRAVGYAAATAALLWPLAGTAFARQFPGIFLLLPGGFGVLGLGCAAACRHCGGRASAVFCCAIAGAIIGTGWALQVVIGTDR